MEHVAKEFHPNTLTLPKKTHTSIVRVQTSYSLLWFQRFRYAGPTSHHVTLHGPLLTPVVTEIKQCRLPASHVSICLDPNLNLVAAGSQIPKHVVSLKSCWPRSAVHATAPFRNQRIGSCRSSGAQIWLVPLRRIKERCSMNGCGPH